ncbi:MAG: transposase [Richelia sp. RM1_1_1]|nr:transposase [Richelia sp. RM1_1_1]
MPATNYALGYYYCSPEYSEKIDKFKAAIGDTETTLVSQYTRGLIGRNRDLFLDLAKADAEAREIPFKRWGKLVYESDMRSLPPAKHGISLPPLPLVKTQLPEEKVRRKLNYITLGTQNLVFFKLAQHYFYGDRAIDFVSDIVADHLDRLWEPLYASQVAADNFENW